MLAENNIGSFVIMTSLRLRRTLNHNFICLILFCETRPIRSARGNGAGDYTNSPCRRGVVILLAACWGRPLNGSHFIPFNGSFSDSNGSGAQICGSTTPDCRSVKQITLQTWGLDYLLYQTQSRTIHQSAQDFLCSGCILLFLLFTRSTEAGSGVYLKILVLARHRAAATPQ